MLFDGMSAAYCWYKLFCIWKKGLGAIAAASVEIVFFVGDAAFHLHCTTMQYHTIQSNTIPCNTIQCHAIQYSAMQYHAIQYNAMQYHAIQGWPLMGPPLPPQNVPSPPLLPISLLSAVHNWTFTIYNSKLCCTVEHIWHWPPAVFVTHCTLHCTLHCNTLYNWHCTVHVPNSKYFALLASCSVIATHCNPVWDIGQIAPPAAVDHNYSEKCKIPWCTHTCLIFYSLPGWPWPAQWLVPTVDIYLITTRTHWWKYICGPVSEKDSNPL